MLIHFQIAASYDVQIEQSVHGNMGQHVIEKANPGCDTMPPRAI
jgi:hypothetical protein